MNKDRDIIVVTGATGKQGGAVARHLLAKGYNVRALTRKPQSDPAKTLEKLGAKIIQGDFDDASTLERAFEGNWGVFAMQNTWEAGVLREEEQGKRMAEIAKKKGVAHYVYTSVSSAQHKTGIPHFDNKWRIEETVRRLKFPSYTILRPAFFMDNFNTPNFAPALKEGKLMIGLKPTTPLQMVAVEDIGKFGLRAFEKHEEMNGVEVDLAGDKLTMPATAEILGKALGKNVEFVSVPIAEIRKFSEDYAIMLEWFERVGYSVDIPALEKEYGIKMTKLSEWAKTFKL